MIGHVIVPDNANVIARKFCYLVNEVQNLFWLLVGCQLILMMSPQWR
jgi:hypothetical protein